MKRFSNIFCLILLVGLSVFLGYGEQTTRQKAKSDGKAKKTDYFPLEEGWVWEYQCVVLDKHNKEIKRYKITIKNLDEVDIGGNKATRQDGISTLKNARPLIHYYKKNINGVLLLGIKRHGQKSFVDHQPPELIIKYPVTKGTIWTININNTKINKFIDKTDDTIKCPAGTFEKCIKIKKIVQKGLIKIVELSSWYAPDVGFIYGEATNLIEGFKVISALESFTKPEAK